LCNNAPRRMRSQSTAFWFTAAQSTFNGHLLLNRK
jgi:hypothetical protein